MSTQLYTRDPDAYSFNEKYVTKLVRSFRSHPDILEVPNVCFYENELEACADPIDRAKFCQWEVCTLISISDQCECFRKS